MEYKEFREYTFRALNINSDEELVAFVKRQDLAREQAQLLAQQQREAAESELKERIVIRRVKEYLTINEEAYGKVKKKLVTVELFNYLLENRWFLVQYQDKFTRIILSKLNEFYLSEAYSREEYEHYYLAVLKHCPDFASLFPILPEQSSFLSKACEKDETNSTPSSTSSLTPSTLNQSLLLAGDDTSSSTGVDLATSTTSTTRKDYCCVS